jgi:serine/threonine-protein kinase
MRKFDFWKTDWFLGLAVVLAVLVFSQLSGLMVKLERAAYDLGALASTRAPSDRIAVIAIDDTSISNIGRWPWPRDVHAKLVDMLAKSKAKAVGYAVLFSEPENQKVNQSIAKMLEVAAPPPAAAPAEQSTPAAPSSAELAQLLALLKQAEQDFNTDRKLGASFAAAGNVVLPMRFEIGAPQGNPDKPLPDYVKRMSVPASDVDLLPTKERGVQLPIPELGKGAAALGHLNTTLDADGSVRYEPLLLRHFGDLLPSFSLAVVARALNLEPKEVKVAGDAVTVGKLRIGTDPAAIMYPFFYKDRDGRRAFAEDSFYDVYTGKIPTDKYRDKIVLIGVTDSATDKPFPTPVSPAMPGVQIVAHSVSSILQEHFFVVPGWALIAEKLLLLLVAVYLIVLLPRLTAGPALAVSGGAFIVFLVLHFGLMVSAGVWMQLMLPATLLLIGHGALVSKHFIVTERAKTRSDENSAESNRMLGLAYQGQGLLDQAWDKFRQVPLSEAVMDNLYNLALDFERKRQFNKAESVFRHMAGLNPKFRDLEQRLSRAKQLSETVMLGGSSGAGRTNTSILDAGSVEKPMLGRYQVEKELGKGAMGVVYLGKDPKIGRVVAIKTMALAQEFEADELAEVKERFFREAETAGRLSHPNIVTIYDAGEEHDLCYIAMELLKGGDLVPFCKPDKLLPAEKVVSIIARAAEALGYAHKQNVVHRDVKPANMMYDLETDTLKVADFGIARLTDSSKTKTGMVLGTPSYMSPEQLAGAKIEGRSDLFSLAVSLYQLLSGKLPFQGESMAQLMFKIANEVPADIRSENPSVPPGLAAFLERALSKNPDQRWQTGSEFAEALRAALSAREPFPAAGSTVDIQL